MHSVFAEVTHAGRLFQRRSAATPKAQSLAVDNRAILLAMKAEVLALVLILRP